MKQHDIKYFPTQNETKASTSKRAILTINMRLRRWFTFREDYIYLPFLQQFANSYNRTFHRTIGMTPTSVNDGNREEARPSTYLSQHKKGVKVIPNLKPFNMVIMCILVI